MRFMRPRQLVPVGVSPGFIVAATLITAGVATSGCASSGRPLSQGASPSASVADSGGAIPQIDQTPSPSESPALPGRHGDPPNPACDPPGLRATLDTGPGAGSVTGMLVVTNVAQQPCAITDQPTVEVQGSGGRVVTSQSSADSKPESVRLAPSQTAELAYLWSNWCGAGTYTARLMLQSGSVPIHLSAPKGATTPLNPRCYDAAQPSVFSAGGLTTPAPSS